MTKLGQLKTATIGAIQNADTPELPRWRSGLWLVVRILYAIMRDLAEGQINLRAMSLVYTTLLSLVPLLAITFSVLKGFGVHNQIEPLLLNVLAPLGEKGVEITTQIIAFVDNMRVGVLGSLGLGLLIYTVIALMQKIERAFNYAWHVTQHRTLAQRFSDYLSVIIIGPLLIVSALGITGTVASTSVVETIAAIQPVSAIVHLAGRLVPYILIIAAFTFLYMFIPNTKVRFTSAVAGGFAAGVLWETVGWAFASYIVTSTKYAAVYAAFSTLILFMIWLYLSWVILLVGASIAFYCQNPEYTRIRRGDLRLSNRMKESLSLTALILVAQNYYRGAPAWNGQAMAQHLGLPTEVMTSVLSALEGSGLLAHSGDGTPTYLPGRPPDITAVKDVLDAVRSADEKPPMEPARLPEQLGVERLLADLDRSVTDALEGRTLKDLALAKTQDRETPIKLVPD